MGFILRLNTMARGYMARCWCVSCVCNVWVVVWAQYLNTIDHENWIRSIMVRVILCVKLQSVNKTEILYSAYELK